MTRKPKTELQPGGRRLEAARKLHGDSREEFGALIDKGRGAVYSFERGITPIPLYVRELARDRYGVRVEDLGPMPDIDASSSGKNDPAAALALWVLRHVEDKDARDLALGTLERRVAQKS